MRQTVAPDILDLFQDARRRPFPFLLESLGGGRFTYLGSDPRAVLIAKRDRIRTLTDGQERTFRADPFEVLREMLRQFPSCAPVGWFGYDLGEHVERLPHAAVDDLDFPDLFLGFYDRWTTIDREDGVSVHRRDAEVAELHGGEPSWSSFPEGLSKGLRTERPMDASNGGPVPVAGPLSIADRPERRHLSALSQRSLRLCGESNRSERLHPRDGHWDGRPAVEPDWKDSPVRCNFTMSSYLSAIRKAKEYIAAGDIYQVNLSQRFEVAGSDPLGVYARLREASPSDYAAYLELGDRAILSSSPEQFLEIRGRRIVTRPIKGTRPLGRGRELLESPKDDAELAMIVDLERNDLGRVCEYGSVRVEAPKVLETHPTLHHLSATISGRLRDDVDVVDVLRATFPGGSVTGAPKIRAMEIIDELEPTRRGVYTGAIGHLGLDGGVNLSVAIRMLHFDRDRFRFQVGGAIVADSDPEEEYRETLVKAAGMARALGIAAL